MRGTSPSVRESSWPTRPGRRTWVNRTVPSCSRGRTANSPLSPPIRTSQEDW
ncbi:hypothetical protein AB0M23_06250 [Streptomyces sp. NPDC052077]|uniref:hypothetical protein n=1 Tax=Streptomyces sp. NPDC052077 TaxID=3154757 RepID=UPI003420F077